MHRTRNSVSAILTRSVLSSFVRIIINLGIGSEIPQKAMSALLPKADMCGATGDVRFGPEADIEMSSAHFADSAPLLTPSLNYQLID